MEHIDIKFIAKKSGCSIATVSRVINRSKPVSEELQKRVIDTIRKYNYNPSIYAQNLAGKKSNYWFYHDQLHQSVSASAVSLSERVCLQDGVWLYYSLL